MKFIIAADEWLIAKHEAVADWAHTINEEISPYWIAAQCSGAVLVTAIARYMLDTNGSYGSFNCGASLLLSATQFTRARIFHNLWKKTKLAPNPQTFMEFFFRVMWDFFVISTIAMVIISPSAYNFVFMAQDIILFLVWHFMACRPPSPRFRRQLNLVPDAA